MKYFFSERDLKKDEIKYSTIIRYLVANGYFVATPDVYQDVAKDAVASYQEEIKKIKKDRWIHKETKKDAIRRLQGEIYRIKKSKLKNKKSTSYKNIYEMVERLLILPPADVVTDGQITRFSHIDNYRIMAGIYDFTTEEFEGVRLLRRDSHNLGSYFFDGLRGIDSDSVLYKVQKQDLTVDELFLIKELFSPETIKNKRIESIIRHAELSYLSTGGRRKFGTLNDNERDKIFKDSYDLEGLRKSSAELTEIEAREQRERELEAAVKKANANAKKVIAAKQHEEQPLVNQQTVKKIQGTQTLATDDGSQVLSVTTQGTKKLKAIEMSLVMPRFPSFKEICDEEKIYRKRLECYERKSLIEKEIEEKGSNPNKDEIELLRSRATQACWEAEDAFTEMKKIIKRRLEEEAKAKLLREQIASIDPKVINKNKQLSAFVDEFNRRRRDYTNAQKAYSIILFAEQLELDRIEYSSFGNKMWLKKAYFPFRKEDEGLNRVEDDVSISEMIELVDDEAVMEYLTEAQRKKVRAQAKYLATQISLTDN